MLNIAQATLSAKCRTSQLKSKTKSTKKCFSVQNTSASCTLYVEVSLLLLLLIALTRPIFRIPDERSSFILIRTTMLLGVHPIKPWAQLKCRGSGLGLNICCCNLIVRAEPGRQLESFW